MATIDLSSTATLTEPAETWRSAVHRCPLPALIVDLVRKVVVDANAGAKPLVGLPAAAPLDIEWPLVLDERHHRIAELLAMGGIDAYEGRMEATRALGGARQVRVWVRALVQPSRPRRFAIVVASENLEGERLDSLPLPMTRATVAAGAMDAEWVCQWITADVTKLLGYRPDDLIGTPLLALAHPSAAVDLVEALGHASLEDGGAVVHPRLRAADGAWRQVRMIVAPSPDATGGVVFLIMHDARRGDLDHQVRDAASQALRAGLARDGTWPAGLPELSSRQWEIVTRLRRGERVPGIARAMHLGQSTVRNHLSAVFRKFAVHSQEEFLLELRRRIEEESGSSPSDL